MWPSVNTAQSILCTTFFQLSRRPIIMFFFSSHKGSKVHKLKRTRLLTGDVTSQPLVSVFGMISICLLDSGLTGLKVQLYRLEKCCLAKSLEPRNSLIQRFCDSMFEKISFWGVKRIGNPQHHVGCSRWIISFRNNGDICGLEDPVSLWKLFECYLKSARISLTTSTFRQYRHQRLFEMKNQTQRDFRWKNIGQVKPRINVNENKILFESVIRILNHFCKKNENSRNSTTGFCHLN